MANDAVAGKALRVAPAQPEATDEPVRGVLAAFPNDLAQGVEVARLVGLDSAPVDGYRAHRADGPRHRRHRAVGMMSDISREVVTCGP
ncbi:hypothetical protein OOK41_01180 [Micromonospora sp. NBC_01655]|uniref:hypothetical protein n=1 Tax=Micromonospora sp. NBC_01655 TaxID=2975983 RepID=UPI002257BDFA|nr:hypothetical protein [Micromonospora sp. NBC_01655]MCX4468939.1 hypothetical protein [Micromonospora sp. NBC_01655]